VVSFFLLTKSFPMTDTFNLARYNFAFLFATVLAVLLVATQLRSSMWTTPTGIAKALALFAFFMQAYEVRARVRKLYEESVLAIGSFFHNQPTSPAPMEKNERNYEMFQNSVPAGEPILVMADEPYWFNYRRNRILNLDIPGAAGYAPGIPLLDGPEVLAE